MKEKRKKEDRSVQIVSIFTFIIVAIMLIWYADVKNKIKFESVHNILIVTSKNYYTENSVYPKTTSEIIPYFNEYLYDYETVKTAERKKPFNNYPLGAKYKITDDGIESTFMGNKLFYEFK